MRIERRQFVHVEPGGTAIDVGQVKPRDRLLAGDNLVIPVAPTQPQQRIEHGLDQIALLPVLLNPHRAVTLGQLGPIRAVDQRNMPKGRQVPTGCVVNLRLTKGVVQVIVAPDNVGHAHVVIIHTNGEHVGRRAVSTQQDEVVDLRVLYFDPALNHILDHQGALGRCLHTNDKGRTRGRFGRIAVAPAAIVAGVAALSLGGLAHLGQLFGRGEALVGAALGQHLLRDVPVTIGAGGLEHRVFIVIQTHPGEAFQNGVHGLLSRPLFVRILNSK